MNTQEVEAQPKVIHYFVNDEPQETKEHVLTPRLIMERAGINPDENYLVELRGHHQESYQGRPDVQIHMHEHQQFITIYTGPTPVS